MSSATVVTGALRVKLVCSVKDGAWLGSTLTLKAYMFTDKIWMFFPQHSLFVEFVESTTILYVL